MDFIAPETRDPAVAEFKTETLLKNAERQSRARHYEDLFIVDVDAHHYETESFNDVAKYIEDPVLRQLAVGSGQGMAPRMMVGSPGFQDMGGRINRYRKRTQEKTPSTPHRDVTLTRRWMDAMGTDMVCLFPTPMLQLGLHPQTEIEVGLSRAYNRWLIDNVLEADKRIVSMLYLPFNDPEACYQMVKDFGGKPGVIGFVITSVRYKPVYDNAYMKTYALIEEMGLPLAFHAGYNWMDRTLGMTNKFLAAHALGFTVYSMIHLTNWIVNGLPERFPKLKVIWIESGLAWVPFLMQRLDNEYMMRSSECPGLKQLPSDYMRQMYYSTQPMEMVNNRKALELTFEMIKAETQLMYSSDYPHWDMDLPRTIYDLPFLGEQAKRNILGETAQRVFNLNPVLSPWKIEARKQRERTASENLIKA